MSNFVGYIEYQKREYCKDIKCPIQALLDEAGEDSLKYEAIRGICKTDCIHTTHQFHGWLNQHDYIIVKRA